MINNNQLQGRFPLSSRRLSVWGFVVLFALQQFAVVHAQYLSPDLDIDPPVIDHEALEIGVAGESQLFSAQIIDDKGIEYVDMYYRASANNDYLKAPMAATSGSDRYTVTVPTELGQARIEYYIEAADTGGNRVLKGFPFFPLVRNLNVPVPVQPTITTSTSVEESGGGQSKLLYVLLGALAVGLLVSASSGGDGNDNGTGTGGDVPLTINITSPAN